MVFNDIINLISLDSEKLKELDQYIERIRYIVRIATDLKDSTFYYNINYDYTYNSHKLMDQNNNCINLPIEIRGELRDIQVFELMNTIQNLESLEETKFEANCIFKDTLKELKQSCNKVYKYLALSDKEQKKETLNLIKYFEKLLSEIDFLKKLNTQLIFFRKCSETNYDVGENEDIFLIQFHDKNMTIQEISSCIEIINSIYERTCNLFEISVQDFKLKPIKLESGSWLEKIIGHEKIFVFIEELLNKIIGFTYRNYTNEGKIKGQINKIDLIKEELNLIDMCEKHGIDTKTAKQTFEGNLNALCQDVCKLTTKSKKITVNEKTYDRDKEISKKVLEEYNKIGIKQPKEIVLN